MRNQFLEYSILTILAKADRPLSEYRLGSEVCFVLDEPNLSSAEFNDALSWLSNHNLISKNITLLGTIRWAILDLGREAIKEFEMLKLNHVSKEAVR